MALPTREQIERIIRRAVLAPSGDNAQPWRFEVLRDGVYLYNIPGKDYTPYNFRERGSFFANGAVIENIAIASSAEGYEGVPELFPISDSDCIAHITFSKSSAPADPLATCIEARTTNRKPYAKRPLSEENAKEIIGSVAAASFGTLHIIASPNDIRHFATTVSLSDRLIFEERKIHDAIFYAIRWTRKEEEERRGLYVKTMELPPPAQVIFKMMKSWSMLTALNKIKMSRFIASQAANGYAASSAIGMLTIPDDTKESFVKAGRTFERLWLTATRCGVSIQPVTALAYLDQKVTAGEANDLTSDHAQEVRVAQKEINALFGNPSGTVAMMFRMGYGNTPTARSEKSAPAITYTDAA